MTMSSNESSLPIDQRSRDERVAQGQFYTPAALADLTLAITAGDLATSARLLDPTCGDGAFLAAACRQGANVGNLHGRDRDRDAISAARTRFPGASLRAADLFVEPPTECFDVIVGNPPYVQQKRIADLDRERIAAQLLASYPTLDPDLLASLSRRGDLAACVLARSACLLSVGGRMGFVVSSALLDADYANDLWKVLASVGVVSDIVSAPAERWFAEAAVNTIILVFQRRESDRNQPVNLWRLRQPTTYCAERVRRTCELEQVAERRTAPQDSPRRWGQLLRAPSMWLDTAAASSAFTSLAELATIQRGVTSGANDVFYATREAALAQGIEAAALKPLVRPPKKLAGVAIAIDPAALEDVVVSVDASKLEKLPGAKRYFDSHADKATRPSLRARTPWWQLPSRKGQLFLAKAYASRFVQRYSPVALECDQRVYALNPREPDDVLALAAVLNCSFAALAIEALGRSSMGQGALEWTVADAHELPVIDYRRFDAGGRRQLVGALVSMSTRSIGTAAAEVGKTDRLALDHAAAGADPTLRQLVATVAEAVAEAAEMRLRRATTTL